MTLTLRKALHSLNALTELGAEISSDHDFEEVMRASLHNLLGAFAIPRGAIAQFVARPRQVKIISAKGLDDTAARALTLGRGEVQKLLTQAHPLAVAEEHNGLAPFLARHGELLTLLQTELIVPVIVCGDLMGLIFLSQKFSRQPYSDEERELIHAMAQQIGVAIYNHRLLASYKRKAEENRRLYREMRQTYQEVIEAFGAAIDLKDGYTSGHSRRVGRYAEALAREMGVSGQELENIATAGYLHDIGKVLVDSSIINKPGPLTEEEYNEMKKHVSTGYKILSHIRRPWKEIAYLMRGHHERLDGRGYPDGLSDEEIPLGSKIVTLADCFDAMITNRPYRSRLTLEDTLGEIRKHTGRQFAPEVVAAFCRLLLRELASKAERRIFLPMAKRDYDRDQLTQLLELMLVECNAPLVEVSKRPVAARAHLRAQ